MPNNRINSDSQFRCVPLPAGYGSVLGDCVAMNAELSKLKRFALARGTGTKSLELLWFILSAQLSSALGLKNKNPKPN